MSITSARLPGKRGDIAPRGSARPPSLPRSLAYLTDDCHRPRRMTGFIPTGWVPPPYVSEDTRALLPVAISEYERALVPSSPEETRMALSRLAMSCRLEDMPERAWEMHLSDFVDDLGDVPLDIVHDVCRQWRRTNKFWPTIAEFLDLVGPKLRKRRRDLDRLNVLARVAKNPAPGNDVDRDWYAKVTRRHTT